MTLNSPGRASFISYSLPNYVPFVILGMGVGIITVMAWAVF